MDWFLYDIGLRHERVNGFTVASTNTNLRKRTADSTWLSFLGSFLNFYRCHLTQYRETVGM